MSHQPDRYLSTWEQHASKKGGRYAALFKENFEDGREVFATPLTTAYRRLKVLELGNGTILDLGIGTGQVEKMAGIDSARISAIEVSQELAIVAQRRLPQAKIRVGTFEVMLPRMASCDIAFASESLDCIYPPNLPTILAQVRQKTHKIVIPQIFVPNDEFYGFYYPMPGGGSHGGPGIEGWTPKQRELVEDDLNSKGVKSNLSQPENLLDELQVAAIKMSGLTSPVRFVDLLHDLGYKFQAPTTGNFSNSPYPVVLNAMLDSITHSLAQNRDRFLSQRDRSDKSYALYIKVHTTHRLAQLIEGAIQTSTYFAILGNSLIQAGFDAVEHKSISVSDNQLVNNTTLNAHLNEALAFTQMEEIARPKQVGTRTNKLWLPGAPMTFYEPSKQTFAAASVHYLVGQS